MATEQSSLRFLHLVRSLASTTLQRNSHRSGTGALYRSQRPRDRQRPYTALHHCEDHKLVAVNADREQVTEIADAPANAGDIDFDARHYLLFVADPAGSLLIFRRDSPLKYSKLHQAKTDPGARTMIVSQKDSKAYLATSKFGKNTETASEELQYHPHSDSRHLLGPRSWPPTKKPFL